MFNYEGTDNIKKYTLVEKYVFVFYYLKKCLSINNFINPVKKSVKAVFV